MPNGHGNPRFGVPVLVLVLMIFWVQTAAKWRTGASWVWTVPWWVWTVFWLLLAVLFGWRLAYHLHMWGADEYGGAYTPEERWRATWRRYIIAAVIYVVVAVGVSSALVWLLDFAD